MCVEFCCLFSGEEYHETGWILIRHKGELIPEYHTFNTFIKNNYRFFDTKAEAVAVAEGIKDGCATCFFRPYNEVEKAQELREFYEKLC